MFLGIFWAGRIKKKKEDEHRPNSNVTRKAFTDAFQEKFDRENSDDEKKRKARTPVKTARLE